MHPPSPADGCFFDCGVIGRCTTALSPSLSIRYTCACVMFGAGFLMLWLFLAGYGIKDVTARAILTLTGHLRTRPDPWLESALRKAFADFDRELTAILHDRVGPARPAGSTRHAGPADPP